MGSVKKTLHCRPTHKEKATAATPSYLYSPCPSVKPSISKWAGWNCGYLSSPASQSNRLPTTTKSTPKTLKATPKRLQTPPKRPNSLRPITWPGRHQQLHQSLVAIGCRMVQQGAAPAVPLRPRSQCCQAPPRGGAGDWSPKRSLRNGTARGGANEGQR